MVTWSRSKEMPEFISRKKDVAILLKVEFSIAYTPFNIYQCSFQDGRH